MMDVTTIAAALKPWAHFYSHYKAVPAVITWVHLAGILVGGGFALASDSAALRAWRAGDEERRRVLHDFSAIHRPVVISLAFVVASGVLQTLADVETFAGSKVYWMKMGLVVLLLANGYGVMLAERNLNAEPSAENRAWGRFRFGAVASATLWLGTLLAGTFLVNS